MQKVCVIGLDREKEEFISRLMDFGVVELADQTAKLSDEIWAENVTADESRDKTARLEEKISRANLALEVIEKYGNLKQPLFATRRKVSMQGLRCLMADSGNTIREQVEDILNLNHRINAICERRNKLEQDETSLKAWEAYDLPLELAGTKKTLAQTGVLPMGTDTDALAGALAGQAETDGTVFKIVHIDKDMYYAAILMLTEQAADVQTILKQYGFSQVTFGTMKGTASENLIRIQGEKDVLRAEYAQAAKEAAEKAAELRHVECRALAPRRDEVARCQEFPRLVPVRQVVDGVRTCDEVERHLRAEALSEQGDRIRCVGDALAAHLDVRCLEVRVARHRELRHREPVLCRGDALVQLEGRMRRRDEQDLLESIRIPHEFRRQQVARVDGVKRAAHDTDAFHDSLPQKQLDDKRQGGHAQEHEPRRLQVIPRVKGALRRGEVLAHCAQIPANHSRICPSP